MLSAVTSRRVRRVGHRDAEQVVERQRVGAQVRRHLLVQLVLRRPERRRARREAGRDHVVDERVGVVGAEARQRDVEHRLGEHAALLGHGLRRREQVAIEEEAVVALDDRLCAGRRCPTRSRGAARTPSCSRRTGSSSRSATPALIVRSGRHLPLVLRERGDVVRLDVQVQVAVRVRREREEARRRPLEAVEAEVLREDVRLVRRQERRRILDVVGHLLVAGEADVIEVPAELELVVAPHARQEVAERLRGLVALAHLIGLAAEGRARLDESAAQQHQQRLGAARLVQVVPRLAARVAEGRLEKRGRAEERRLAHRAARRRRRPRRRRARHRDRAGDGRADEAGVVVRAAVDRRASDGSRRSGSGRT